MMSLPAAFGRALGQLTDPAILKVIAKSMGLTVLIVIALGLAAGTGVDWLLARGGMHPGGDLGTAIGALLVVVGGWLLFRIIALAVLQFFADDIVCAVEARFYPDALATARKRPFREEAGDALRSLGRTIMANGLALLVAVPLLFTAIGPAVLFLIVNAWLLGREFQDMAWLRHRAEGETGQPIASPTRFLLGGTIAGLMLVPFVNLLAPVLGAAAATHLVHRRQAAVKPQA